MTESSGSKTAGGDEELNAWAPLVEPREIDNYSLAAVVESMDSANFSRNNAGGNNDSSNNNRNGPQNA